MRNLLPNVLVVIGFCLGAIGAAGFHSPTMSATGASAAADSAIVERTTEANAWTFLIAGVALLGVGSFLGRAGRDHSHEGGRSGAVAAIRDELVEIQGMVAALDEAKDSISDEDLMRRIDDMRTGILFDLGSRSESFAAQIGFDAYAHVWGDFATCERLLNRCWSMTADGASEEARHELPLARAAIDASVASAASLT